MELFKLFGRILIDSDEADKSVQKTEGKASQLAKTLGSGITTAAKWGAGLVAAAAGAATAVVGALLQIDEATEEYRIAQGKLNTAFEAAGMSADAAKTAYNGFYSILGDTDTATEASQLLAKLANSEEDLSKWTDIAAGVYGTFGDSLPVEGLIEAANETVRTGTVTGGLADALNWAAKEGETFGVKMKANTEANEEWNKAVAEAKTAEDYFNLALQSCGSEAERNQLIMDTLSGTYDEASKAFYRNNDALVASRNAQAQMDAAMASLGETVSDVKTKVTADFLPSIAKVIEAFSGLLSGAEGADLALSQALGELIEKATERLPEFLGMGTSVLSALISGIIQSLPTLVEALPVVVSSIVEALMGLLYQLADVGAGLLGELATGIERGIPQLVESLPGVIKTVLDFIADNLPGILDQGGSMVNAIADGVLEAIPAFAAALPEIITSFIGFIQKNLPTILSAGVDILINLIEGIIKAIPQLYSAMPEIISSITSGLAALFPDIIKTGVNLLTKLWDGIFDAIPTLVANLPEIMTAIVNGLTNLMSGIVDVGLNIAEGLWEGIKSGAGWLKERIKGWANDILDGVKEFFGIHSPSRVMRDQVGVMLARGVADGMEKGIPYVTRTAAQMGKAIQWEIDKVNAEIERIEQEERRRKAAQELKDYKKSVEEKYEQLAKAEVDARQGILDEIAELEQEWNDKQVEAARSAEKEAAQARLKELEAFQSEYEDALEEITNAQSSMAEKLAGYGDLFTEAEGKLTLGDLQGDIDQIRAYGAALTELEDRRIPDGLMDEITDMDVSDALAYAQKLLSMSDEKYDKYMELWEEKQAAAKEVAEKFYRDELSELQTEYVDKIPESLSGLKAEMEDVGADSAQGLADGFSSMLGTIKAAFASTVRSAVQAAKEEISISGSDGSHASGLPYVPYDGYRATLHKGETILNAANSKSMVEDIVNGIAGVLGGGGSGQAVVVKVYLDKQEIAEGIFDPLSGVSRRRGQPIGAH